MPESLPGLRDDLRITPLREGKTDCYVIEDPLRNLFFKIGRREYRFLSRLHTLQSQVDLSSLASNSDMDVSEEEALAIMQWLAAKQLLRNQNPEIMRAIMEAEEKAGRKSLLSRLNIISFRVSLFNPDPFLDRFHFLLKWMAGPVFLVLWCLSFVTAVAVLLVHWSRFVSESAGFFSPFNMFIIGGVWLVLKLLHELSHALACKRYGGGVYDFGILFILFIPLTYVNGSTSWTFPTRWQRLHVAVAGIYMELFVAWIAVIFWVTHIGTVSGVIAHNTVLVAGVSSLLFNANPLMRFDGYFVLSDLTGIPNLYFRGLDSVRRSSRRWWLGIKETSPAAEYSLFVRIYGVFVYLWRFVVLFGLGFAASRMFNGWGMLITVVAAIGWVSQPVVQFFRKIPEYKQANPRFLSHLLTRLAILSGICGFLLFGLSWNKTITVPAVVLFEEQYRVRADVSGFIQEIFIVPGEQVTTGQKLVQLVNEDLAAKSRILSLDLATLALQKRVLHSREEYGELQILEDREKVLVARKRNVDEDLASLTIYAPGDGMVVGRFLESRLNTLVQKGEELFLVVTPKHKHLVASVAQNDIAALLGDTDREVVVDMRETEQGSFTAKVDTITPRASTDLPHFSFAAPFGGSFDVRQTAAGGYQLFSPRFTVYITIPEEIRHGLRDGQQATVQFQGISRSPAAILLASGKNWFLRRQGVTESEL